MIFFIIIERYTFESKLILGFLFAILLYLVIHFLVRMLEMAYVLKYRKPYYTHFYFYLRKLNPAQNKILKNHFVFYVY